jgi:hypothetical protein
MHYAVICSSFMPPRVLSSHFFLPIARLALWFWTWRGWSSASIAEVDTAPQAVINICEQRDDTLERLKIATELLANLVSRDEEGRWTTVHNADAMVDRQAEYDILLA